MNLWNLFKIFLRFGFLAWGGPVAQINMIREELVEKRQWINHDKFKRVLAIYQSFPASIVKYFYPIPNNDFKIFLVLASLLLNLDFGLNQQLVIGEIAIHPELF
ncbi:MAG: chromate transporter [Pseudomonadota bacterium]